MILKPYFPLPPSMLAWKEVRILPLNQTIAHRPAIHPESSIYLGKVFLTITKQLIPLPLDPRRRSPSSWLENNLFWFNRRWPDSSSRLYIHRFSRANLLGISRNPLAQTKGFRFDRHLISCLLRLWPGLPLFTWNLSSHGTNKGYMALTCLRSLPLWSASWRKESSKGLLYLQTRLWKSGSLSFVFRIRMDIGLIAKSNRSLLLDS